MFNKDKLAYYNNVPVVYCATCLSLKIKEIDGIDYCEECKGSNISEGHIKTWIRFKKNRKQFNFIDFKSSHGRV